MEMLLHGGILHRHVVLLLPLALWREVGVVESARRVHVRKVRVWHALHLVGRPERDLLH